MSMNLMAKAMSVSVGNPLRKLVLLKLADNANDQGEAWPSVPHIAQQCEMSERSVQNHINKLSNDGFLWVERRKKNDRLNQSNIYHLTIDQGRCSGESPAPRSGANAAPRTSHSLEPVNEPYSSFRNSDESQNLVTDKFLSQHPDAVVYTKSGKSWGTADDAKAAEWIYLKILDVVPTAQQPSIADWANEIRLIRLRERITHKDICELFKWANQHHFWSTNILSPRKLRKHWDTLQAQRIQSPIVAQQKTTAVNWDNTDWADELGGII